MIATAGRWTAATASARGATHVRRDKPNQDAVRVVERHDPPAGLVAAVCDGHGGERYVHSDVGAQLAAEVACRVGEDAIADIGPVADPDAIERYLAEVGAPTIVDRWRKRVLDDAARRVPGAGQTPRSHAESADEPFISYGCTLLLAVLAPEWVGLLQIGDGDIVVADGAAVLTPVPTDDRLVGGETTSLCLPTAVSDARVRALDGSLPDLVFIASDGYGNSFAEAGWHDEVSADLRRAVREHGMGVVDRRLPEWLAESARVGGDDVSMALIQRLDTSDGEVVASDDSASRGAAS